MKEKFIIKAELRALEKRVSSGEISYSRMIELLNEKADKWLKRNPQAELCIDCGKEIKKQMICIPCKIGIY